MPVTCKYLLTETGEFRCGNCGDVRRKPMVRACECAALCDGEITRRTPPLQRATAEPCIHRGGEMRRVGCQTCNGGGVQIKVLSCQIHGECTIATRLDGVACCEGCTSAFPG